MAKKKEIVVDKELNEVKKLFGKLIDYGYSPYETFDDFLNVVIISILNAVDRNNPEFDENEEEYKKIVEKYGENKKSVVL